MSDGTGRIYRRGKVWWVDYGFRGDRYRESTKSHKKSDATALLRKRMEEMGRGRLVGPREEAVTFEDLAVIVENDYKARGRKSLDRLQDSLKHLRAYFGLRRALDITTDRITAYIQTRQKEGAANATIQKELAALKRAFNLAVQAGRLTTRPYVPSVTVSNVREGFFDAGEVEAVIAELDPDVGAVVRFASLTGWRKREILNLRWAQVDFEAGMVRLEPGTTKNSEGREFPFAILPPLEHLIREQRKKTDAVERKEGRIVPWVFHRNGRPIKSLRGAWQAACGRAGLDGAWFHDLRRSAVRNLERAGVSRSVAMKLTGHKTEAVYRRYAIADQVALEEGVAKLAQLHATEPHKRKTVPLRRQG